MAANNIDMEKEGPNLIQSNHDEAFMYISQGLAYEEQNQLALARDMYVKGLDKIDVALNVRCDRPYCLGPQWDKARALQQKMRKNVQVIKGQLEKLSLVYQNEIKLPSNGFTELPPTYDEACELDSPLVRRSSCPVVLADAKPTSDGVESEVDEVFNIPAGVQLFFVSAEGLVTTPSSTTSLHVYKFNDEAKALERSLPSAWLQVGDWRYPLVPGQSPALESGYGAFIFPDVASEQDTASVGLILPAEVDYETRRDFERVLASLTALVEHRRLDGTEGGARTDSSTGSFSDSLSRGIVTGAGYLSTGLIKGATVTGEYIHKGATKLKQRLHPEENPKPVDPRVKEGLKVAKNASTTALKVSGFLVCKLGDLTIALGNKIAPYVREQGTKLLTNTFKNDPQQAKDTVDGVAKVAAGGLQGFSAVYMGLENAARILAYSLSTETVNVVGHKYGEEVGEVVGNALHSVGNLALTTRNVQTLGVKSIAKKTAKDAGKAVLKDYANQIDQPGTSFGPKKA